MELIFDYEFDSYSVFQKYWKGEDAKAHKYAIVHIPVVVYMTTSRLPSVKTVQDVSGTRKPSLGVAPTTFYHVTVYIGMQPWLVNLT